MSDPELPHGWTVTHERRVVATEDADSAFTDGHQWTVRDPAGELPPQSAWPTAWHDHAVRYAWMLAARRSAALAGEPAPPYAASGGQEDMLPRVPRDVDPRFRPFAGNPTDLAKYEQRTRTKRGYAPTSPDRILVRRPVPTVAELVALCSPAKLALGVTQKAPAGQLGPGWTWWARHGFGISEASGRITESVYLRVDRAPRSALFLWSRPVPDPRLIHALAWQHSTARPEAGDPIGWPLVTAVLAELPAPEWASKYVTAWTTTATGRPEDIPRPMPSAAVKKEVRS